MIDLDQRGQRSVLRSGKILLYYMNHDTTGEIRYEYDKKEFSKYERLFARKDFPSNPQEEMSKKKLEKKRVNIYSPC